MRTFPYPRRSDPFALGAGCSGTGIVKYNKKPSGSAKCFG